MAFDTQTVTIKGAELLAAATAQDKLIIVGCDVTQTYMTQAQAVNISARPASPFSNTTTVTQIGSNSNHINSRVYFRAGENTGGDANTLFLYGHKQSDPTNDFVIFIASAETPFHLPVAGDVVDEWETALDIVYTINADAVGYAEQSTYCTLSEFNLLKERTVTTHKEGEPTQGDIQTIYGDKTFNSDVICAGWLTARTGMVSYLDVDIECEEEKHGIKFILSELPEATIMADDADGGTIYIDVPITEFGEKIVVGGKTNGLFCTYAVNDNRASALIEFENTQTGSPQIYLSEATTGALDDYLALTVSEIEINSKSLTINYGNVIFGRVTMSTVVNAGDQVNFDVTFPVASGGINNNFTIYHANLDVVAGNISTEQNIHADGNIDSNGNIKADGNIETSGTISVKNSNNITKITLSDTEIRTSANGTTPTFSVLASDGSVVSSSTITCGDLNVVGQFSGGVQSAGSIGVRDAHGDVIISINAAALGTISIGTASIGTNIGNGGFSVRDTTRNQNAYMHANEIGISNLTKSVIVSPEGISGLAPIAGSVLNIPIGGIIGVFADAGELINSMSAGTLVTVDNTNTGHIYACKWSTTANGWVKDTTYYIPDGSYRSITGFVYSSTSAPGLVLLQRVA